MAVCPLVVSQYANARECYKDGCKMWHDNDCIIRTGMIAFIELMTTLSAKSEVR